MYSSVRECNGPGLLLRWMQLYMRLWTCSTLLQDGQTCSTSLQESTQNGIRQQGQMLRRGIEMEVTAEQRYRGEKQLCQSSFSDNVQSCRLSGLLGGATRLQNDLPKRQQVRLFAHSFQMPFVILTKRCFKSLKAAVLFLSWCLFTVFVVDFKVVLLLSVATVWI